MLSQNKPLFPRPKFTAPLILLSLFSLFGLYEGSSAAPQKAALKTPAKKVPAAKAKIPPKAASTKPAKAPFAAHKPKAGEKEMLWRVSSESGATIYLLGTIHVFRPEYYPLPDEMEKAFAKSKALLVEIDISRSDPKRTAYLLSSRGIYPSGDDMTKHLSTQTSSILQQYCMSSDLQFSNLIHMKPWLADLTITQKEFQRLGYSPNSGIDRHFIDEANMSGKKIIGLETEEFQLTLFSELSPKLQEALLNQTFEDLKELPVLAGDMMRCWWTGDEKGLDDIRKKDNLKHPEFEEVDQKILYDRNIQMADKLEAYLKGSDTFMCAVGAAHMVGEKGICALLKSRGYKVSQVLAGEEI
ncbi:MAG: TraB/GumN family protein [Candidatus Obscuribacterales bacterium]|nr:TraB/GumN family protein [Candidatus Obscuribacterales bacterium]